MFVLGINVVAFTLTGCINIKDLSVTELVGFFSLNLLHACLKVGGISITNQCLFG